MAHPAPSLLLVFEALVHFVALFEYSGSFNLNLYIFVRFLSIQDEWLALRRPQRFCFGRSWLSG